jgi:TolA-binding protein
MFFRSLPGLLWLLFVSAQDIPPVDKAVQWFKKGDQEQARVAFRQILGRDNKHPVALFYLGQLEQNATAAEQYYLRLLYHAPRHEYADDALLAVARLQYAGGRYTETVQACNRFLNSFPDSELHPQSRYLMGCALLLCAEPALARMAFLQLLKVAPESEMTQLTHLGVAETFRAENDLIEAARHYLKFETLYPQSDSLHLALFRAGLCLEMAGRPAEAAHVYQRLLDRFPDTPEAATARTRKEAALPPRQDAP